MYNIIIIFRRLSIFAPALVVVSTFMWGSAFAVCITHSSLTCQFEHSGKVHCTFGRDWNFLFSLLSGLASFPLCCADEFTKNETACCPQIEYIPVHIFFFVLYLQQYSWHL